MLRAPAPARRRTAAASATTAQAGIVRVSGTQILDRAGNPKAFRGWNFGRLELVSRADVERLAGLGVSIVRLVVRFEGLYQGSIVDGYNRLAASGVDPAYLQQIRDVIGWCAEFGIEVLLAVDSNCAQSATQSAEMQAYCRLDGLDARNGWNNAGRREAHFQRVELLVRTFGASIAMVEPLPEPDPDPLAYDAEAIKQFYRDAYPRIRRANPHIPIVVGGRSYGPNSPADAYLGAGYLGIVGTINFLSWACLDTTNRPARIAGIASARTTYGMPYFVQQVGTESGNDPSQVFLGGTLDDLNGIGCGWTVWEYEAPNELSYGARWLNGATWTDKPAVIAAVQARL